MEENAIAVEGERKMYCQKCGAAIPVDARVCDNCGAPQGNTKFCQHCGATVDADCIICPKCGKQIGQIKQEQPQVIINNSNTNSNVNTNQNTVGGAFGGRPKNKWVAFFLCLFLGYFGAHKFYEGKVGMGIIYLFTGGLFVIGAIIDLIVILTKPNPYYV